MIFYRCITKIRAISFDLDDTLYDNHPFMIKSEKKLLEFIQSNFPATAEKDIHYWRSCRAEVIKKKPELISDMGKLRSQTLRMGFYKCGYTGLDLTCAVDQSFEYFYYQRSNFKVDKAICSLLSELAAKLPLVAITNGNVNLQQIGIHDYFETCYHANVNHPMKPDRSMFDLARGHLALPAKQILHVGDNLEKDVMGAKQAGFSSAWWACNRPMDLRQESTTVLPDVTLESLEELLTLVL